MSSSPPTAPTADDPAGVQSVRSVTAIAAAVITLTFLFGFGNVWALATRLEVTPWVAPLVAPAGHAAVRVCAAVRSAEGAKTQ